MPQPPEPVTPGLGGGWPGCAWRCWAAGSAGSNRRGAPPSPRVAATLGADAGGGMAMAQASRAAAFLITSSEGGALHLPTLRTQTRGCTSR